MRVTPEFHNAPWKTLGKSLLLTVMLTNTQKTHTKILESPNSDTETVPSVESKHVKLENGGPSKRKISSRTQYPQFPQTKTELGT